ncbi:MAG: anti-sigma factor antagonist [Spirochaetaceae bacterium]|nr:MAG: anti-sigma factor antagonist [Spirochaetaceae bacterium]
MANQLLYREEGGNLYVRALGKMTANISYSLRGKIFARLKESPPVAEIYMDLSQCDYMDSTFMGIIIGINKNLKEKTGRGITIVCPTDECNSLFAGLNIIKLLNIDTQNMDFPASMETVTDNGKPKAEVLLHAHEDLMEISEENSLKFSLLKEYLEKKLVDEQQAAAMAAAEVQIPGLNDDDNYENKDDNKNNPAGEESEEQE